MVPENPNSPLERASAEAYFPDNSFVRDRLSLFHRLAMKRVWKRQEYGYRLRTWGWGFFAIAFVALTYLADILVRNGDGIGPTVEKFSEAFQPVHGSLTALVVIFGVATAWMILQSEVIALVFNTLLRTESEASRGRWSPKVAPLLTGMFERFFIGVAAIALLRPSDPNINALAIVVGGYVVLRTFRIDLGGAGQGRASLRRSSVHALWNVGTSVAFAVLAGWLFWRVPYSA